MPRDVLINSPRDSEKGFITMLEVRNVVMLLLWAAVIQIVMPRGVLAEISDADFKRLQTQLQPGADEPWRTIPWKISLLDAQKTAAKEKKPIFIWAMDGHPLGCT
jgi:hypothetical protein